MKTPFSVVGKTLESNLVVSGCWLARDRFGTPFDTIFDALKSTNAFPDWLEILEGAKKQNVNKSKSLTEIESETVAAFGKYCWGAVGNYFADGLR